MLLSSLFIWLLSISFRMFLRFSSDCIKNNRLRPHAIWAGPLEPTLYSLESRENLSHVMHQSFQLQITSVIMDYSSLGCEQREPGGSRSVLKFLFVRWLSCIVALYPIGLQSLPFLHETVVLRTPLVRITSLRQ